VDLFINVKSGQLLQYKLSKLCQANVQNGAAQQRNSELLSVDMPPPEKKAAPKQLKMPTKNQNG